MQKFQPIRFLAIAFSYLWILIFLFLLSIDLIQIISGIKIRFVFGIPLFTNLIALLCWIGIFILSRVWVEFVDKFYPSQLNFVRLKFWNNDLSKLAKVFIKLSWAIHILYFR